MNCKKDEKEPIAVFSINLPEITTKGFRPFFNTGVLLFNSWQRFCITLSSLNSSSCSHFVIQIFAVVAYLAMQFGQTRRKFIEFSRPYSHAIPFFGCSAPAASYCFEIQAVWRTFSHSLQCSQSGALYCSLQATQYLLSATWSLTPALLFSLMTGF